MAIKSFIQDGEGTSRTAGVNDENCVKTVDTKNDIPVAVDIDQNVDHDNQAGILAMAVGPQGLARHLETDSDNCLQVNLKHAASSPGDAIYTIPSNGDRIYHMAYAINSATPAIITSTTGSTFDVGGEDFTITVNGGSPAEVISFPSRAATTGYAYGGINPYPKDGWPNDKHKIKVSVNGGALTEVEIGKIHNNWDEVAYALQTKIRTEVPNGTDVVVLYNTVDFPYRMAAWSGTTGSSSSIHFAKGGDDLAKDMQMMVGYDYHEVQGTDADVYRIEEVAEYLSAIPGVLTTYDTSITLTTSNTGTSATLQVSSGGANTVLQFPTTLTTGQNGTGEQDLSEDGSITNLYYTIPVPSGRIFVVKQLFFIMKGKDVNLKEFGAIAQLTNGVQVEFRQNDQLVRATVVAKTNAELFMYSDSGEIIIDAFNDGFDGVKAIFEFPVGFRLRNNTNDAIEILIQDDLSDVELLEYFYVLAKGWLEP